MKLKGSFGCSDHEMLEFERNMSSEKGAKQTQYPEFQQMQLGLFRDLPGRVP